MHIAHVIPPVAVLLGAYYFLSGQVASIDDFEHENAELQNRIIAHSSSSKSKGRLEKAVPQTALDAERIDWRQVVFELKNNHGGHGYLKTNRRIEEGFHSMSYEQLQTAVAEVEEADLAAYDRSMLLKLILRRILESDPERGFTEMIPRYLENGWSYTMGTAYGEWAATNPDAAVSWYENQVEQGAIAKLSHKGKPFLLSALLKSGIFTLISERPDLSTRLLAAVPEKQRIKMLGGMAINKVKYEPENQKNWAEMVRSQLTGKDRLKGITNPLGNWSDGDGAPMSLDDVDGYMERIQATEDELRACILVTARDSAAWRKRGKERRPFVEDLKSFRSWVNNKNPDLVDAATLSVVESNYQHHPYKELSAAVLEIHKTSANDELLVALLKNRQSKDHKETALQIASELTDEGLRAQYVKAFQ